MPLTNEQIPIITIAERTASSLSLLGAVFVVSTFLLDSKFRKPINRLVFYAMFGNVMSNCATLISRSGTSAGQDSGLCQIQGFLIQWFMPADILWTFSMACNVYLSFFHGYNTTDLRALEPKYFALCYGVPFVPAFVYLFISTKSRGKVYGDAVLWCWVDSQWSILRLVGFYAPVLFVFALTIAIYTRVALVVFRLRKRLISFQMDSHGAAGPPTETETEPSGGMRKTYEVLVTSIKNGRRRLSPTGGGKKSSSCTHVTSLSDATFVGRDGPRTGSIDPNKAAMKYCKCALLFFIALLITWVPSTVNRIYTLVHGGEVVFALNFVAAAVLPLQGFWNAVIYMSTSTVAMKSLFAKVRQAVFRQQPCTDPECPAIQGSSFATSMPGSDPEFTGTSEPLQKFST